MPLLVRGSGGGKNTKDATAVPGDVRNGKTFYGADGKQTGIWTPKVTDYTGDATAEPGDVKLGKVFYNNMGRQEGVKSEPILDLKVLNLAIPKQIYHGTYLDMNIDSYMNYDTNMMYDHGFQGEVTFRGIKIQSFNFIKVLGFEVDGILLIRNDKYINGKMLIYDFIGSKVNDFSFLTNLCIGFKNNSIYLGHQTYPYMDEFTSIEPDESLNLKVYYI